MNTSSSKTLPYNTSLLIIPTFNEILNIEAMIECVTANYPELTILFVDDNSPDGTAKIVRKFSELNPKINLIERTGKRGLGLAYISGFKWALDRDYQFILEMDCDFSHDTKDIANLLDACQNNDLVIGSRFINGMRITNWPLQRLILSYMAGVYTRFITGFKITDPTSGFKCFKRSCLESLNLDAIISNGYSFQIEMNYKVWVKMQSIKEIPIIFTERKNGSSKMSRAIIIEAIFSVMKLRLKKILNRLN